MHYRTEEKGRFPRAGLIREQIGLARRFLGDHPEIGAVFRAGATAIDIAHKYGVAGAYPVSRGDVQKSAYAIARFALRGNQAEKLGVVFDGAIPIEDLAIENSGRQSARALKSLEMLDQSTRRKGALLAIQTRGLVLWKADERALAWLLSGDEEFRTKNGKRVKNATIANVLNQEYQNGEPVRNPNAVYLELLGMERGYRALTKNEGTNA